MKKHLKKFLSLVFMCALVLGFAVQDVEAAETVHSGKTGNLNWSIDADGHFTLTGTGNYDVEYHKQGYPMTPWYEYAEKIESATVNVSEITSLEGLFYGCDNLQTVNLKDLDTSKVTDMSYMFYYCMNLATVDVSTFNTANVTDMSHMFNSCYVLESIDVSAWDTSKVTDMSYMFGYCEGFEKLDLSSLETANVTNMASMFEGCEYVKTLDLSKWNTSKVTNMSCMFYYCSRLQSINMSGCDVAEVVTMDETFKGCKKLVTINAPLNLQVEAKLPADDKTAWYDEADNKYEALPLELTASIKIEKMDKKPEPVEPVNPFVDVFDYDWFYDSVMYVNSKGLMSGSDGKFMPNDNMTRAMMVTTLYRMEGSPKVTDYTASDIFSDVERGSWYEDAVNWAYNEGVTTGYPELMLFGSNDNVTREQLAVFLYRYADKKGLDVTKRGDVTGLRNHDKTSDYATEGISWAVGTGLISGIQLYEDGVAVYDLAPQGSATRAQLATILMRFCEYYNL